MALFFTFQNFRGPMSSMPTLADGQLYWQEDTGELWIGTASSGNVQIGGTPSGAAGGDLSGTYPNPTVAKVNGAAVPASQAFVGTNSSSQVVAATAGALPSGTTATTQSANDNSTKVATTAYADNAATAASHIKGVNAQTGTTYTFLQTDLDYLVSFSNALSIAATLPQAGSGGNFGGGWTTYVENTGVGTLTITPTTSTINGAATLVLTQGEGSIIVSDGTNYFTMSGTVPSGGFPASVITSGQLALARGGTAADLSATGGTSQFLKQSSMGAAITVGTVATGDLPTSGTWAFAGTFSGNSTVSGNELVTGNETHGLASYTAAVANSPTVVIAGSYENAATPTYAEDSWTIQDVVGSGLNGSSALVLSHSGTSGPFFVQIPEVTISSPPQGGLGFTGTFASGATVPALFGALSPAVFAFVPSCSGSVNQPCEVRFYTAAATTTPSLTWDLQVAANTGSNAAMSIQAYQNTNGQALNLACGMGTSTSAPGINLGGNGGNNNKDFTATSGTQVAVAVGGISSVGRVVFNPASGTAAFQGFAVTPTIEGTSSGTCTACLVNPTFTTTHLSGVLNLIDIQSGGTSKFTVNNAGHINNCNSDVQGNVSSVSGTTVSVTFTTAYASTPTVVVTPTTNAGAFYLSAVSSSGFTITYATSGAQTFNYQVLANPT